ncbi:heavy metal translocating P-type ATPase [Methylocystis parvus]|uniref:P-type Zn(2+) transporter n=1 Tax=Methylocystis parvus TaxID=134 RepID=A0A6B8M2L3_9HYPH|nr:heavy metal translocating P-type ATPase [Methylocystis parvus]QGM99107.1 heavy metal translocating P-type ATPase [Methylocystis parvus]WBK00523.1 heavy metal translocating P-type ATPase [Methylocystis parvus OBBP]
MQIEIRHHMPGRVRVRIPSLRRDRALSEGVLAWVRGKKGVRSARINYDCASLVVEYERAQEPVFRLALGQLRLMTLEGLRALTAGDGAGDIGRHEAKELLARQQVESRRFPLLAPTISLALAFAPHPAVRLVNGPLMLWNAYPIALRAYKVWRNEGRLNVDFLDALAIGASLIQGNYVAGALITWLIKLGDWIRDLTAAGSKRAIGDLLDFRGKTAWILRDGSVVSVSSEDICVGDEVVVYPGEMIPVDGEIIDGAALIDQKTITGEGLPVTRGIGEAAFAATVIREGQITIRAQSVGGDTTAGQIVRLIDSAPVGDTRMQNHAERLADRLVVPTLGVAMGASALSGDFSRFLSLVIVDYGTGIRVAAPTAVLSSMTRAAREGIIIKSGRHMEKLAEVDTVVFDKTGTLTRGNPEVIDIIGYQRHIPGDRLLGLAAAAESRLQHPVAEALRRKAAALDVTIPPCDEMKFSVGLGVEGQIEGHYLHVGNERFMRESGIRTDAAAGDRAGIDEQGYSCLYVAMDGQLAGLAPYADEIRKESSEVISRLHSMGVKNTVLLTGDNAVVAKAVGRRLGLTRQYANMLPTDKADVIQELQRDGRIVAMVGDGINDSPALSFADVGVAMKHGAEVTHESADVVLMEDSLYKLVEAFEISRGAVSLIKQNYGIVVVMNTLALGLALPGGLISPSVTAVLSNGSAILASLNAVRPILRYR